MEKVFIHLEHCYGIPLFKYQFEFNETNKRAHIIYAPNGTMKSSFAHTLKDITIYPPVESRDRYFPTLSYNRIVKHGDDKGKDFSEDEIFVVESRKEYYYTEKMSLLLANENLKSSYDGIHRSLNEKMDVISKALVTLSGKKDAVDIFCNDFDITKRDYFEQVCALYNEFKDKIITDFTSIKYGKIFPSEADEMLTNPDFVSKLENYIKQYASLLLTSDVFRPVFSHTSAEDILAKLEKSGFFNAEHKVILHKQEEKLGQKEFSRVIEAEKQRIINEGLADEFKEIDDVLRRKNATTDFRNYLFEHQDIIPMLRDIPALKRSIWLAYLFSIEDKVKGFSNSFEDSKLALEDIIKEAKEKQTEWQVVVDDFNRRFINMPFTLAIENKEDVILEEQAPALGFQVGEERNKISVESDLLLKCLSEGEKKALYLLNVLFEIEALKRKTGKTLIVFDDVADSFDYKNKYAIIEYIIDVIRSDHFLPIILTHNFDFFRTLASRANLYKAAHFIELDPERIDLKAGRYCKDIFHSWKNSAHKAAAVFVACIPFLRNLVQYKDGSDSKPYKELTSLLHYYKHRIRDMAPSGRMQMDYLFDIFSDIWSIDRDKFIFEKGKAVTEFILKTASDLSFACTDKIALENKITLSIAIRLCAEMYMVEWINDDSITDSSNENRTRFLFDKCKFNEDDTDEREMKKILSRVLIITSENIHINSFMYEPLIDISFDELCTLYHEVSKKLIVS